MIIYTICIHIYILHIYMYGYTVYTNVLHKYTFVYTQIKRAKIFILNNLQTGQRESQHAEALSSLSSGDFRCS